MPSRSNKITDGYIPTFTFGNCGICAYCGDVADSKDHVIPLSYQTDRPKLSRSDSGPMTFACRPCNSFLSNRMFPDFRTRCEFVRDYLNRKSRPVLWSMRELGELDYGLRKLILKERNKRLWIRARADWYEGRDYLLNIEMLLWEPRIDRYSQLFHKATYEYFWSTIILLKELT